MHHNLSCVLFTCLLVCLSLSSCLPVFSHSLSFCLLLSISFSHSAVALLLCVSVFFVSVSLSLSLSVSKSLPVPVPVLVHLYSLSLLLSLSLSICPSPSLLLCSACLSFYQKHKHSDSALWFAMYSMQSVLRSADHGLCGMHFTHKCKVC